MLPGVRTVVNDYINLTQQRPWQEGVCAALTELFAATIHAAQLANWPTFYRWIEPSGLEHFRSKLRLAPQVIDAGLRVTRRDVAYPTFVHRTMIVAGDAADRGSGTSLPSYPATGTRRAATCGVS